ncbi:MAG TPA: hypothetical protein VGA69_10920 [Nitriliruptorales bacterium]
MDRRPLTVLLLAAALVALPTTLAIAGGGGGGVCAGFGEGTSVVMRDSCFEGTGHIAPAGSNLVAVNEGQMPHTITAVDGSFDSGTIQPGESFEFTLDGAGHVPVYCTLHGTSDGFGMAGVLIATDSDTASAGDAELATATGGGSPTAAWITAVVIGTGGGVLFGRRRAT